MWRRAHDRFVRGVDRVHQVLARLPEGDVHEAAATQAARLAALVEDVFAVCAQAQHEVPTDGLDVPGGHGGRYLDVHRCLSRAGVQVAQAAQSLTLARVDLEADPTARAAEDAVADRAAAAHVTAALRCVDQAEEQVRTAAARLAAPDPSTAPDPTAG